MISIEFDLRWFVNVEALQHPLIDLQQIHWNVTKPINRFFSLRWEVGIVHATQPIISWRTENLPLETPSVYIPMFSCLHTSEHNSEQVIRIRSARNPSSILFESDSETVANGFMSINAQIGNIRIPTTLIIKEDKFSNYINDNGDVDIELAVSQRKTTLIDAASLPGNVFLEYKSVNYPQLAIRYLGWLPPNPQQAITGLIPSYNPTLAAARYGVTLLGINREKIPILVQMRLSDDRQISGMIPSLAGLVLVKFSVTDFRIGYVEKEFIGETWSPYQPLNYATIKSNLKELSTGNLITS